MNQLSLKSVAHAIALASLVAGCTKQIETPPPCDVSHVSVAAPPGVAASVAPSAILARPLPAGVESERASVDGIELHYLRAGSGPPVLLLHGYTQTSRMWLPLMQQLSARHTVIAPDLRGAGGSAKPDSGYEKTQLAKDVHGLMQQLGQSNAAVVGHDIGLMVAYAYAAQYPGDVQRVTLMDAFLPGIGNWKDVWLLRDLWHFHFTGETPLKLVAGRERIYFEHFWNDFAADPHHSLSEADREFYSASYAQPGGMAAGFNYFKSFEADARDFAKLAREKLPMPMLVLTGQRASGTFLIDQARLVAKDVDGRVIEGSGHWLMEEAPDQVMPQIVSFVDKEQR